MSASDPHLRPPLQEPEGLPIKRAAAVGVAALVIFSAGAVWVGFHLKADRTALGGMPPIPSEVGGYDVGLVTQRPFDLSDLAERKRAQQVTRLNNYGWVDRQKGRIHIPIEAAMRKVAERAKR